MFTCFLDLACDPETKVSQLEGHPNSLIAPQGDEERGVRKLTMSEDAKVYPM